MDWIVDLLFTSQRGIRGLLSAGAWTGMGWLAVRSGMVLLSTIRVRVLPALADQRAARRLDALPPASLAQDLAGGGPVRLRGRVEAVEPRWARFSGLPAVVCKDAFGERGGALLGEDLEARDFVLRLEDGTPVRVQAWEAYLNDEIVILDRSPHRWEGSRPPGGWFRESRVSPGDEIEVAGMAEAKVDPNISRLTDRQAPLAWTLSPARGRLILHFATRPAEPAPRPAPALRDRRRRGRRAITAS